MPATLANLNGRLQPLAEVTISALDRGFLFGDSVYEVLRVIGGRPWLEKEHWQRLERSLAEIRIAGVDLKRLASRVRETIAAGPFREAMVYLQISRGAGARRRHAFNETLTPTELLWVEDFNDAPVAAMREKGVALITHPDLRWGRCDIKSTNLLANVMANTAAAEKGASEALFYLPDGSFTEGSHSSLFWVKNGTLCTTPIAGNILPSITRDYLIGLAAAEAIPFRESPIQGPAIFDVDELFMAGTTWEVMPGVSVDGRTIADGKPGPIARRLLAAHQDRVAKWIAEKS